jgi:preprotein translocase subunit SecA
MRQVEKFVLLSVIDNLWMDHLDAVENLRQGIGLRGYGQKDPLVEYKNEAYKMFEQLINAIDDEVVHRIYKIQVQAPPMPQQEHQHIIAQPAGANSNGEVSSSVQKPKPAGSTIDINKKKLGRNDPCWCGSGKKYKRCHYPN